MIGCSDTLIKVCGLTRQEDADVCVRLKANLTGFIFHPASPRNITPEAAAAIDTGAAMRVGVFLDQSPSEIRAVMDKANLFLAQLHGGQDEEFCQEIGRRKVMKVFWPERYAGIRELEQDMERFAPFARFYLLDAGKSGGGHGKSLDFSFLGNLHSQKSWFLAGGLGPDNLPLALSQCSPCGVDLNSGVESAPGIKDPEKLRQAFSKLCVKHTGKTISACG